MLCSTASLVHLTEIQSTQRASLLLNLEFREPYCWSKYCVDKDICLASAEGTLSTTSIPFAVAGIILPKFCCSFCVDIDRSNTRGDFCQAETTSFTLFRTSDPWRNPLFSFNGVSIPCPNLSSNTQHTSNLLRQLIDLTSPIENTSFPHSFHSQIHLFQTRSTAILHVNTQVNECDSIFIDYLSKCLSSPGRRTRSKRKMDWQQTVVLCQSLNGKTHGYGLGSIQKRLLNCFVDVQQR